MLLSGEWKLGFCKENMALEPTGEWTYLPAQVPGNVELDLVRAGLEKDPFYAENIYDFHKYDCCMWEFSRTFTLPEGYLGQALALTLEGVNTYGEVFVNDVPVGQTDNMLIPFTFDVSDAVHAGENEIKILLHAAGVIARQENYSVHITKPEYVWQRKPPHSFGWDIMPRLPSAGLWRNVHLDVVKPEHLTQVYLATKSADEKSAQLVYFVEFSTPETDLTGYSIRIRSDGFRTERPMLFTAERGEVTVPKPRLWWPAGYGEQPLYDVTVELLKNGQVIDAKQQKIGIRKVEIVHKMAPGDEGEFLVKVNGEPVLLKGSNWVPLDAMHSRDADRYEQALALFQDCGCNILRCWGGNVYEDHRFFDLCDEYGIFVWQDFTMACSTYPQNDDFMQVLETEASTIVQKLRNHPSILLWAGDNEVDETYSALGYATEDNNENRITRELLPRVVREQDPYRMFLPSSPYILKGIARYDVPEQHNWGPRAYFKDDFYKNTKAHFISECGYHGCPAVESLKKFIPEDKLWPYTNSVWSTHDTDYLPGGEREYNRNQLMADQVKVLFGFVPDTLEEFSFLSQISQAEAKKFFVERTRVKKWRRTGIIWWNMLDGWPQISDAVVDYYFTKKRAYGYIKRVQKPICVIIGEQEGWELPVYLCNDSLETKNVTDICVKDADTGEILLAAEALSKANENDMLGKIRSIPGEQRLLLISWKTDGKTYGNHYITGFPTYHAEQMKNWAAQIDKLPE